LQNPEDQLIILRHQSALGTTKSQITLAKNLFSFLLEGCKCVQYAGTKAIINPHQFMLLSAGNCLMSEKIAAPQGHYDSILFFFDNELLTDFFIRHPNSGKSSKAMSNYKPFLVFEKDAFIRNFIESLGLLLLSGQPISQELQRIKLEELLVYISVSYPKIMSRLYRYNYDSDQDLLIRQVVTTSIYNANTVDEMAFLCNMTLSTFKRHFASIYGTSPNKWLIERRMERAAQLLTQNQATPSEIYQELGYENLSSFIKTFKQIHKVTPKQYQLNNLNV
jgi:AraC-like DNA-binding protein